MIPCSCLRTASEDHDVRLYAQLDALEAHPVMVQALEETRRLRVIADALIAFARIA